MKRLLNAGDLDRRIIIQRATSTRDEYNAEVQTWGNLASRAASYEPLTDGERAQASEISAAASARFRIRWSADLADLNPKDRLMFEGKVHDIEHVKEIGRRVGLEITTAARADGE